MSDPADVSDPENERANLEPAPPSTDGGRPAATAPRPPTTGPGPGPASSTWIEALRLRLALLLVRSVGHIVPRRLRSAWVAEWRAELLHRHRLEARSSGRAPGPGLVSRSLSSVPHALTLAGREWNPDPLRRDIGYASRRLTKSPGFTIVAALTLAVGIGANTAIFSVVHSTLIRPLPWPEADRVVYLWKVPPGQQGFAVQPSAEDIELWRQRATSFEQIFSYSHRIFTLSGADEPDEIMAVQVSANFFRFAGVQPRLGRGFSDDDGRADARVVVIADGFWQSRFGSAPDVLGRQLVLDGEPYAIVGVMPPGFRFTLFEEAPLWVPVPDEADGNPGGLAMARLRPGVSAEAASQELAAIAASRAEEEAGSASWPGRARRPQEMIGQSLPRALLALQVSVALILLIAAANLANLLLARGTSQEQEMAIRAALGASRGRLIRQLLAENLLLATIGAGLGFALARLGLGAILALRPDNLPSLDGVRVDPIVWLFTAGVALLTGAAAGFVPALRVSRPSIVERLGGSPRTGHGPGGTAVRSALVVLEVAMSVVLLVGAGLFIHSLGRLLGSDPGFEPDNVLALSVSLPASRYPGDSQRLEFRRQLDERLAQSVGGRVQATALGSGPPVGGGIMFGTFAAEGEPAKAAFEDIVTYSLAASPGWFSTLRMPLLHGRDFVPGDEDSDNHPVIVNAEWARRMWGTTDAVGERMQGSGREPTFYTVVGVVDDAAFWGGNVATDDLQVYFPLGASSALTVLIRATSEPLSLAARFKEQIWALDPELPVTVATIAAMMAQTSASQRFTTTLMTLFAAVALGLALIGVYGVLAYSVGCRTREIGIRMALGADRRNVVPMVVREGMRPVLLGLLAGIAAAIGLGRFVDSLLYEVTPTDPATYVAVSLLLLAVAAVACWIPARRAARVDHLVAFRGD